MSSKVNEIKESRKQSSKAGEGLYRKDDRMMFSIDDDDDEDEDPDMHAGSKGGGADLDLAGAVVKRKLLFSIPRRPVHLKALLCAPRN